MALSDAELMRQVARNDEAAVAELLARMRPMIQREARRQRRDPDEVVQLVLVRLWRSAHRYDGRKSQLITWAMRITRTILIDLYRRGKHATRGVPLIEDFDRAAAPEREPTPAFASIIEPCAAEHREMLTGLYARGWTLAEYARMSGLPLGTVKSRLWRALRVAGRGMADRRLAALAGR